MEEKILVVDDEVSIANAIAYGLKKEGYKVETAFDGQQALDKIKLFQPQILILDVMMPKLNGFDVLKSIGNRKGMGVVMLTAKNEIFDKILGLELGADDYMTKPFDMRELMARIKSLIRRLEAAADDSSANEEIFMGQLHLMLPQRKVLLRDEVLDFTPKEFDLLVMLISNPERVYSRDELLDKIWGIDYVGGTRTVDIHVQRIRKKLGAPYQDIVQTIHGVGYKAIGGFDENQY
ncbi:MAG: response regulator with CheY-like receiver domain and winged-helix DNA-binding domain [Clostridia bacterium]|nr:response regulator with CheY-like receiver domain and winged-helix DNA-binding domain [Clostridia bacterium]